MLGEEFGEKYGETTDMYRMTILASNSRYEERLVNPNVLEFIFEDTNNRRRASGKLTLIDNIVPQLHWQVLRVSGGIQTIRIKPETDETIIDGEFVMKGIELDLLSSHLTVPVDVILTKISPPITPPIGLESEGDDLIE